MPRTKIKTSVSLDPETVDYLDTLAREAERSRSWVVKALARLHAELRNKQQPAAGLDGSQKVIRI